MKKTTLKQLATELGVSVSTVSKALNNSPEISEETRQKVRAFAKLYNYKPNIVAQNLKNNTTKTIGILIPEIVHHFFTTVIQGAESVAQQAGYKIIIGLSNESLKKEKMGVEMFLDSRVDGLLLSLAKETQQLKNYEHLDEISNDGTALALFDRINENVLADKVIIDDEKGARQAVELLIQKGSKKIALITTADYLSVGQLRKKGYYNALKKANIPLDEKLILKLDHPLYDLQKNDVLQTEIEQLFRQNPDIDGVVAVNELYAINAIKVSQRMGFKVPKDVQVVAFTDGLLSRNSTPSLSTVNQHGFMVGEHAMQLLIDRIQSKQKTNYQTVIIETEIIERESTR